MKKHLSYSICISLLLSISACDNKKPLEAISDNNQVQSLSTGSKKSSSNQLISFVKNNSTEARNVGNIRGDGLYSDQTELYFSHPQPKSGQNLQVKLRAYKNNLTEAKLVLSGREVNMKKSGSDNLGKFDYWVTNISAGSSNQRYVFKVKNGNSTGWYNAVGFHGNRPDGQFDFWLAPKFQTPEWTKNTIFYQIFVDRFFNGDTKNDVKTGEYLFPYPENPSHPENRKVIAKKWGERPEQPARNRDFFGGDIEGVRKKLNYLSGLGVKTIYFNPIFNSPSNHKYDTQDYGVIDPHFGTNEEFKKFVDQAHAKGMKVVLDGVFNHTGNFHKWFDRSGLYKTEGAFESKNSPWHSFYTFQSWPQQYSSWWGFQTLPKLNYGSQKLRDAVYRNKDSVAREWLSKYNVDGWRLDVPNEAGSNGNGGDHSIWQEFRKSVKSTKNDAVILGEIWKNPQPWLQGDQFDAVMNYEGFADPVSVYMTGYDTETHKRGKISTTNFVSWLRHTLAKNPTQANQAMMNLLGSHDTSRYLRRAGEDKWKLYEAAIFQMTYVGAPMIYYGDEIGTTGGKDPDCRRTFDWGFNASSKLHKLYKKMTKLRNTYSALRTGSFETIKIHDIDQIFAYSRMDKKSKVLVILNNSSGTKKVTVPVEKLGWKSGDSLKEHLNNTTLSTKNVKVDKNGNVTLSVYGHYGAVITGK